MDREQVTPARALMALRIIWFGMVMGMATFLGVVLFLLHNGFGVALSGPAAAWLIVVDHCLMLLIAVGMLVRARIRAVARRRRQTISLRALASACIVPWAVAEGVGLFTIVIALLTGRLGWNLTPLAVAAVTLLLTFPVASQLQPPAFD